MQNFSFFHHKMVQIKRQSVLDMANELGLSRLETCQSDHNATYLNMYYKIHSQHVSNLIDISCNATIEFSLV